MRSYARYYGRQTKKLYKIWLERQLQVNQPRMLMCHLGVLAQRNIQKYEMFISRRKITQYKRHKNTL